MIFFEPTTPAPGGYTPIRDVECETQFPVFLEPIHGVNRHYCRPKLAPPAPQARKHPAMIEASKTESPASAQPEIWFMPKKGQLPIHLRPWTDEELEAHRRMLRNMERNRPH